ncbi:hypothetical protein DH2020_037211 [Rehmannia glutinosa]|uniref:Zinc-finger domain-containing protein n=1 Tax=Rehmannia glutinosa TaxID=99300 RepID=A0ABR0V246_REHGL
MVNMSSVAPETIDNPGEQQKQEAMEKEDAKISEYELTREERIKENRERMQKLGIFDLSLKLKDLKPTPKRAYHRKTPLDQSPLPPSGPVRRSSRLQNSTPVSYCEVPMTKKENSLNDDDFQREEGSKPEVYTDEHEKLLGNTEKSWTLFVDGCGKDGKRIYDPVKGKTCHQCRYGENVLEANENPNWICPVCRGICNCSLCRQAKGWPPTGMLYRKISSLGYKSVAHYLIQTRRASTDSDKNVGTQVPISAKRSLPFSDIEVTKEEDDFSKPSIEHSNTEESGDSKIAEPEKSANVYDKDKKADYLVEDELDKSCINLKTVTEMKTTMEPLNDKDLIHETLQRDDGNGIKKEKNILDNGNIVAPEISPKSIKKTAHENYSNVTDVDSIASRLKMRRRA